jgi:hypothetical protein
MSAERAVKIRLSTDSGDTTTTVVRATGADGIVKKWAVIVGISDYKAINDLQYCDEDATDWYYYLNSHGYSCKVYGDSQPANFPVYNGVASEYNVKTALNTMIATADADDIIVFASSGHGTYFKISGRLRGQTLCMWDYSAGENGQDGSFKDTELAPIMAAATCKSFVFLDHCYSGGMNEMMNNANKALIYLTTTCTDKGYGYDDASHLNGAWTYYFLEYGLIGHFGGSASMEAVFDYALAAYPYDNYDTPQEFDGNTAAFFYL